jgi:hypothetical protein
MICKIKIKADHIFINHLKCRYIIKCLLTMIVPDEGFSWNVGT